mgnify:CR=1 FL=1
MEKYIEDILIDRYIDEDIAKDVFEKSEILQYFNLKSNAIHGSVKSRRSLANWYAIYGILVFYKENNFTNDKERYLDFDGFPYTNLFNYMRTLYGGEKLQNHALNSRANGEFANKIASVPEKQLILINEGKYMIHPDYIYIDGDDLSDLYIDVVDKYISLLVEKDQGLLHIIDELKNSKDFNNQKDLILNLLREDSEARVFEIVAYALLANYYSKTKVFIGYSKEILEEHYLKLYKTGRTNANDGGIDFVMKPLGRFFQVTEVGSYDKYFLDIDKVMKFPITFVVKTNETSEKVKKDLLSYAELKSGGVKVIKNSYIQAIEEVITINELKKWINTITQNDINTIASDIELYYKLELNIE